MASYEIVDGFEDGDLSEWNVDYLSIASGNPHSGTYYARTGGRSNANYINDNRPITGSPSQIQRFRFYYTETSNSSGGGIQLQDSNGNWVCGMVSNNPQWFVSDGSSYVDTNTEGDYNNWTEVEFIFDWGAGQYTVNILDESTSTSFSGTYNLNNATDIAQIYTVNAAGSGMTLSDPNPVNNGNWDMEFDDLEKVPGVVSPSSPQNVSATAIADDHIDVSWDAPSDWGGETGSYELQVSEDGGQWTSLATVSSTTTYSHVATSATNTHQYRVRAVNSAGSSSWSSSSTVTTDPTTLSITGTTDTAISVAWDGVTNADGYDVLLAEAPGSVEGDYSVATSVGGSSTTATVSGLENGERYYARVIARYSGGADSQLTNEIVTTLPVPAPTLDGLDASVEDQITVSWTLQDNSSDGSISIYRSTDGSLGTKIATVTDLSTAAYTDTGLSDGEQYYYTLRRETDHDSADSGQDSAVTVLPAPTNLTVDDVREREVDISWTANHDNGDTLVQLKPADTSTWATEQTLSRTDESTTVTGLRNGEQYDARVLANTEHDQTEDN